MAQVTIWGIDSILLPPWIPVNLATLSQAVVVLGNLFVPCLWAVDHTCSVPRLQHWPTPHQHRAFPLHPFPQPPSLKPSIVPPSFHPFSFPPISWPFWPLTLRLTSCWLISPLFSFRFPFAFYEFLGHIFYIYSFSTYDRYFNMNTFRSLMLINKDTSASDLSNLL